MIQHIVFGRFHREIIILLIDYQGVTSNGHQLFLSFPPRQDFADTAGTRLQVKTTTDGLSRYNRTAATTGQCKQRRR